MKPVSKFCLIAAHFLMLGTADTMAATIAPARANNVVLVHGSFADGSSWSEVITRLQAAGLNVTVVQDPMTSIADDVAATNRAVDEQDGLTVLVGHSYGGTLVSDAGINPKVSALVYVAARAPEANEDFSALAAQYPSMPAMAGLEEHEGYLSLSQDAFLNHFAADIPRDKALELYALQQPVYKTLSNGRTSNAAWHTKPAWYAVSSNDQAINPDLERFLAKRMNAHTVELPSGHLSMVSHAKEITDLILEAAGRQP